ncbi:MAG: acetyl-CoA acetyltransferase [Reyranellaceae bacterium]
MISLDRAPVIVGIGQVNDREEDLSKALDAGGLMQEAIARAGAEAGERVLERIDSLELVRLFSAPMAGIEDTLAGALPGLRRRPEFVYGHGNTPMLLLNRAALRIARGEAETCIVAGAEAYRTEKRLATRAAGGRSDMMKKHLEAAAQDIRRDYGLVTPIEIYPLFENAMRAAWGQPLAEAQQESARIWADLSSVAARNPHAWIRRAYSVEEILTTGPGNRRLCFPYSTLLVANNSVNQGAALIVCSYARARALGIPEDRLVFVGAGAAATEPQDVLARDRLDSSASLRATLALVLERNQMAAGSLDHVELYSCFPCVPKHARRVLGLRDGRPLSVAGGLTFAGGPIRNYMMHAAASMVEALRRDGTNGLLFGNGGYLSEAHALVLSRRPILNAAVDRDFDVQPQADALREPVPIFDPAYVGPGHVESYTVAHDRDGAPVHGTIVGRAPDGRRFLARAEPEAAMMDFLVSGAIEPVGSAGTAEPTRDGRQVWRVA